MRGFLLAGVPVQHDPLLFVEVVQLGDGAQQFRRRVCVLPVLEPVAGMDGQAEQIVDLLLRESCGPPPGPGGPGQTDRFGLDAGAAFVQEVFQRLLVHGLVNPPVDVLSWNVAV